MPKGQKRHVYTNAWFLLLVVLAASVLLTGWQIIPLHIGSLHLERFQSTVPKVLSSNLFNALPSTSTACQAGCIWDSFAQQCICAGGASSRSSSSSSSSSKPQHEHQGSGLCPPHASRTSKPCGSTGISQEACKALNCCWQLVGAGQSACLMPKKAARWETYWVLSTSSQDSEVELKLKLVQPQLEEYGADFQRLQVKVQHETPSQLHIKISPAGAKRWEVPESLLPRPPVKQFSAGDALYRVLLPDEGNPFSFVVTRSSSANTAEHFPPVFNTTGASMVFKDQYLQLSTSLPETASLYGLGQRMASDGSLQLPRDGSKLVLWNYDIPAATPDINLYGSHPFYLQVNKDGTSCGVLLLNSNGIEVTLHQKRLTYRVLGGVFDFYFFLGPQPEAVIRQYQAVVGRPAMPPLWSLGFHSCRWGYRTLGLLKESVNGYKAAGIPLDVVWTDIDYMDRFRDFTFDDERYPVKHLKEFVDSLHASGQRWVPIVDCGIPVAEDDSAYKSGLDAGVFIKDVTGKPYIGQVWPGATHYPDFLAVNRTWPWWQQHIQQMHHQVPFDGLWIDMNEPSNFCTGEVCKLHEDNKLHALMARDRTAAAAAAAAAAVTTAATAGPREQAAAAAGRRIMAAAAAGAGRTSTRWLLQAAAGAAVDQDSLQVKRVTDDDADVDDDDAEPAALSADDLPTASADSDTGSDATASAPMAAGAAATLSHEAAHGYLASEHSIMRQLTTCHLDCQRPSKEDSLSYPPYAIHTGISSRSKSHSTVVPKLLGTKTLPMTAVGVEGTHQYDAHNLYGLAQAAATRAALVSTLKARPFLLTRSTFAGSGHFSAHWGGDNAATWRDLRWSVVQLLQANMLGMAMSGSDICGFIGNTTEELCARWASAGAFYTFSRAHNSLRSAPQELYRWPTVAAAARRALGMRYMLLPYLYTSFFQVHVHGGTVARPLLFEFPADAHARKVHDQWLLGDSLLVSPVLHPGRSQRTAYLPRGCWYDLWAIQPNASSTSSAASAGRSTGDTNPAPQVLVHGPGRVTLKAPVGDIPLHVRGGSIIPMQQPGNTAAQVRASPLSLLVAVQHQHHGSASSGAGSSTRGAAGSQHEQGSDTGLHRLLRSQDDAALHASPNAGRHSSGRGAQAAARHLEAVAGAALPEQCTALLLQDTAAAATAGKSWQQQAAAGMPLVACGVLYMDSGESLEVPDPSGSSLLVYFAAGAASNLTSGWLQAVPAVPAAAGAGEGRTAASPPALKEVIVMGLDWKLAQQQQQQSQSGHAREDKPEAADGRHHRQLLQTQQQQQQHQHQHAPHVSAEAKLSASADAAATAAAPGTSHVHHTRLLLDAPAAKDGKSPSSKEESDSKEKQSTKQPKSSQPEGKGDTVPNSKDKDGTTATPAGATPAAASTKSEKAAGSGAAAAKSADNAPLSAKQAVAPAAAAATSSPKGAKGGTAPNPADVPGNKKPLDGIHYYYENPDSSPAGTAQEAAAGEQAKGKQGAAAAAAAAASILEFYYENPDSSAHNEAAAAAGAVEQPVTSPAAAAAGGGAAAAAANDGGTSSTQQAKKQQQDAKGTAAETKGVQQQQQQQVGQSATDTYADDANAGANDSADDDDDRDADDDAAAAAATAAAADTAGSAADKSAATSYISDYHYSSAEDGSGSGANGSAASTPAAADKSADDRAAVVAGKGGDAGATAAAAAPVPAAPSGPGPDGNSSQAAKDDDAYNDVDYYGMAAVKRKRAQEQNKKLPRRQSYDDYLASYYEVMDPRYLQDDGEEEDEEEDEDELVDADGIVSPVGDYLADDLAAMDQQQGDGSIQHKKKKKKKKKREKQSKGHQVAHDGGGSGGAAPDDDGITFAHAAGGGGAGPADVNHVDFDDLDDDSVVVGGGGGGAVAGATSKDTDAAAAAAAGGGGGQGAVSKPGSTAAAAPTDAQQQHQHLLFAASLHSKPISSSNVVYDSLTGVLRLTGLQAADLAQGFLVEWHLAPPSA